MTDRTTVNRVVLILGLIALLGLGGIIALLALERPASAVVPLVSITSSAAGALGALLVSTKSVDVEGLKRLDEAVRGEDPAPAPHGP